MMKILNNKKGAELALNVVVIASIAMLVLVVVSVIFLRGATEVKPGETCVIKYQGECKDRADCSAAQIASPNTKDCSNVGQICCKIL